MNRNPKCPVEAFVLHSSTLLLYCRYLLYFPSLGSFNLHSLCVLPFRFLIFISITYNVPATHILCASLYQISYTFALLLVLAPLPFRKASMKNNVSKFPFVSYKYFHQSCDI